MVRIVDFEIALGLPVTLADLNLAGATRDKLKMLGDVCAASDSLCANHVFSVTSDSVVDAILAADALGNERKRHAFASARSAASPPCSEQ
jgi:glycerol dehydrogenase